jgi:hypothetical protein
VKPVLHSNRVCDDRISETEFDHSSNQPEEFLFRRVLLRGNDGIPCGAFRLCVQSLESAERGLYARGFLRWYLQSRRISYYLGDEIIPPIHDLILAFVQGIAMFFHKKLLHY